MQTVLFDLGGVVLTWEPHRAYEQVMAAADVPAFMAEIDFPGWNASHDAGRAYADGEADLLQRFPDRAAAIVAYREHFGHTLTGAVPGTGAVLAELGQAGVRLIGLTNWSAETFPHAVERFGLLRRFEGIVVSGAEGLAKPDPAIFGLVLDRYQLDPAEVIFVDDAARNVLAAESVGMTGHRFVSADALREFLVSRGVLTPARPVRGPIHHVADRQAWADAETGLGYPWSGRGMDYEAEGFVHCSFTAQLPDVLQRYYADVDWSELVLLELDPAGLPVVVEDLGHGPYPHLFAELTPSMVRHAAVGRG